MNSNIEHRTLNIELRKSVRRSEFDVGRSTFVRFMEGHPFLLNCSVDMNPKLASV